MARRKTHRPGKDSVADPTKASLKESPEAVDITNAFGDGRVHVVGLVVSPASEHKIVKDTGLIHVARPVIGVRDGHGSDEYLIVTPGRVVSGPFHKSPLGEIVHPDHRPLLPGQAHVYPQRFAVTDEVRHLFGISDEDEGDGGGSDAAVPLLVIYGVGVSAMDVDTWTETVQRAYEDIMEGITPPKFALPRISMPSIAMPGLPDDGPIVGLPAVERYADIVGNRVRELVGQYVYDHPGAFDSTPPELLAETLIDVAIDPQADRSELADLLAPLWSAKRAQDALGGLTRATMHDRRSTGSLLGVKTTDGDIFYPVAQFEAYDGKVRVKPDLRRFMMALRERDPWTVAVLLHTPADELGGLTPLDWVRRGRDASTLVAYAREVDAEFSR